MPIPVITVGQMRQWEQATWDAGRKPADIINNVGRMIARRLESLTPPGGKILFLAGKGHNGDDVRSAREQIGPRRGTVLIDAVDPAQALEQFTAARDAGFSWIVDGLFGIGLNRPLDDAWQKLIEAVNASNIPIFAVDVPSGLNAETGAIEGAAITAERTLTIGAPKLGLLKAPQCVGRLEVVQDVGLVPYSLDSEINWTVASDFAGLPPRRPAESNKGTYGHVVIWAGSAGYHGAAVLATRGALRARPGLVTVYPQESVYVPVASQCQAAMVHIWRPAQPLVKSCTIVLAGPGLAASNLADTLKEEIWKNWRKAPVHFVVDASALDWLQPGPTPGSMIRVITPHPGEAGRILGTSAAAVQADRIRALRDVSKRLGDCYVVLKGHQTLVGRSTGPIFVNSSGNPGLAQGGSGDLLGGYLAGLLAQSDWQKDPLTAIRYAVWQHGAAADRLAAVRPNWTVEDLADELGAAG